MEVTEQQIRKILSEGEGISVEFKECRDRVGKSFYETVCSFLNRFGGTILLGISDEGEIVGVNSERIGQIKKDLVNSAKDSDKIHPPVLLAPQVLSLDEKKIIVVTVPESTEFHMCKGRFYDRSEDGDYDITKSKSMVMALMRRKGLEHSEKQVFTHIQIDDLREDLIEYGLKLVGIQRENHPWLSMTVPEFFRSAKLYATDSESGKSGVTLAGILLFGSDLTITTILPRHRTDLIVRRVNVDRYDDREIVETNLLESFDKILSFLEKHLPDPFHLEGTQRISLRAKIFREIVSNTLAHREYQGVVPARIVIEYDRVVAENDNVPYQHGKLDPQNFSPRSKNPILAQFFRAIGRADELGSGVRNLMRYGKLYSDSEPELIDGDVFKIIVKYPPVGSSLSVPTPSVIPSVTPPVKLLLELLRQHGECGNNEIRQHLNLKDRKDVRERFTQPALADELIEMTIPEKPQSRNQKYRLTEKGLDLLRKADKF